MRPDKEKRLQAWLSRVEKIAAPDMAEALVWWAENGENIATHPECYKVGEIHSRVIKLRAAPRKARWEE
jgi:hypothetical protein